MILLIASASQIKSIVVYFKLQLFYPSLKNLSIFGLGNTSTLFCFWVRVICQWGECVEIFFLLLQKMTTGNRPEIMVPIFLRENP